MHEQFVLLTGQHSRHLGPNICKQMPGADGDKTSGQPVIV